MKIGEFEKWSKNVVFGEEEERLLVQVIVSEFRKIKSLRNRDSSVCSFHRNSRHAQHATKIAHLTKGKLKIFSHPYSPNYVF